MSKDLVWPPGYRINPRSQGASAEMLQAFANVPTANARDCSCRSIGGMNLFA